MSHLYSPNRDSTAVQRGAGPGLALIASCIRCNKRGGGVGCGLFFNLMHCPECKTKAKARRAKA